jgi:hypothetical protein
MELFFSLCFTFTLLQILSNIIKGWDTNIIEKKMWIWKFLLDTLFSRQIFQVNLDFTIKKATSFYFYDHFFQGEVVDYFLVEPDRALFFPSVDYIRSALAAKTSPASKKLSKKKTEIQVKIQRRKDMWQSYKRNLVFLEVFNSLTVSYLHSNCTKLITPTIILFKCYRPKKSHQ